MNEEKKGLLLGIDLGTTTVSAQVISAEDGRSIKTYGVEHHAALRGAEAPDAFAADAERMCALALELAEQACEEHTGIVGIGFTGAMHGIVCLDDEGRTLSPLYTWQNQFGQRRLHGADLCTQIEQLCGCKLPTGYGLVTYFALRELGMLPSATAKIACIADLAVMRFCGLKQPVTHPTHAASLGLFDVQNGRYDETALQKLRISAAVLPSVVSDEHICGSYHGIPVAVAIGDNQAGALACIKEGEVLLNIGTSGQVCFVRDCYDTSRPICGSREIRPYFGGKYLYSGSTLCGGSALAILARLYYEIAEALGGSPSMPQVYELINRTAQTARGALSVSTSFLGSRDEMSRTGSIEQIGAADLTVGELSNGFCRGIAEELYRLYLELTDAPPRRIVASGNALRRNPALQIAAEQSFNCPISLPNMTEEAAYGAALFAGMAVGLL